ncbi:MAG: inositol monophosphatase family protein [Gemmatimonadota bacterium]|nr:inositol monophosphatase family protein [Gemmatimonadota bacterium]
MGQSNAALDPSALLDVAVEAARAGADVVAAAAPRVRTIEWRTKAQADFVSEVDLASEAAIVAVIRARAPGASVLAEEGGAHEPAAAAPGAAGGGSAAGVVDRRAGVVEATGVRFVVDPLDGTTNFLHGYPEYAVSIGVLHGAELVAGVVIDVALGETFTATRGGGAFANGLPLRVSAIGDTARALIGTGFPFTREGDVDPYVGQLARVMRGAAGIRRAGAAALDLAAVAAGRFEAFWETMLSPWDIAAGILLVREAGGVVTDLAGAPCAVKKTGVVAGNPALHAWLLSQLST